MNGEKGQSLPLAIMALALGTLVITPFLGHAGTSLTGSRIYEQGIAERYSCDAGVEYALWGLLSETLVVAENTTETIPQFTINDKAVDVTIENLGTSIYLITSTATSDDEHSTTVTSYVSYGGGWTTDGDITGDTTGDTYVTGDASVDTNVTVDGSIYATGNVTLGNNAEVTGDVVAEGDLDLSNNAIIGGDIAAGGDLTLGNNTAIGSLTVGGNVCAAGDVSLLNGTTVYGSLYTTGNITMSNGTTIKGDVFIGSDIATITIDNNAVIEGSVYITGSITDQIWLHNNGDVYGAAYATGTINNVNRPGNIAGGIFENYGGTYPPHPDCLEMSEPGGTGIVSWE